jgi:hypothetical protein
MEPARSLPHSQQPATCPYPEPHRSGLVSLFHCLGRTEDQAGSDTSLNGSLTCLSFYGEELLAPRPIPKMEDHPLSAVRDCLFNISAATLHIWRPLLHPQPADMVTGTHLSRK